MRNLRLALDIALTHLLAKKRQTIIAMLGVTFGISMFIVMISFMQGVNQFTLDLALDGSPHVRIYNPIKNDRKSIIEQQGGPADAMYIVHHQKPKSELPKIKNGMRILRELEQWPGVQQAAPNLSTQVFYNSGSVQFAGSMIGCDILKENVMYDLENKLETGALEDLLTNPDGILLGNELAEKMNVKVGDRISISTPQGTILLMRVVGTFSFGFSAVDGMRSYATLASVQKILQKDPQYITDIVIRLEDYTQAKTLSKTLSQIYGYTAEDWETTNAAILAGEVIRNVMTFVVSLAMLVVAGFGIYNIMNMSILNKLKDIAILKATGFESGNIVSIFLLQSLIIGVLGGVLGVLTGGFFSYLISITPFPSGTGFNIETFPVLFEVKYYITGILFGFLTTLFAGWFPARRASRVDPVDIIRG